jgi:hypothetical protein
MTKDYHRNVAEALDRHGQLTWWPPVAQVLDEMGATNLSAVRMAVSENKIPPPPPMCRTAVGQAATTYTCGCTGAVSLVPSGSKYHTIQIVASKLCLANPAQSSGNASWAACKAGDQSQEWVIDDANRIHPQASSAMCLDVFSQHKTLGTPIDLWKCNNGENQKWELKGTGLVSSFSKLCLSSC